MEFDSLRFLVWHFESNHGKLAWWRGLPRVGYWRIYKWLRLSGYAKGVRK